MKCGDSPARGNALEYYLALRRRPPADADADARARELAVDAEDKARALLAEVALRQQAEANVATLAAVSRWKFEAKGTEHATTTTVRFDPPAS